MILEAAWAITKGLAWLAFCIGIGWCVGPLPYLVIGVAAFVVTLGAFINPRPYVDQDLREASIPSQILGSIFTSAFFGFLWPLVLIVYASRRAAAIQERGDD
jgi:hypothetical protein